MFQRENNWNNDVNTGIQIIRRNQRTLAFYSEVLKNQTRMPLGALVGSLLQANKGVAWNLLPLTYSSESNGGCRAESIVYHANCTAGDSLRKKQTQLEAAQANKEQSFMGFRCKKEGKLITECFRDFGTRNEATTGLINLAIERHAIPDFDWVYVYTGDGQATLSFLGKRAFGYATTTNIYDNVCPDFSFNHWRETGMDDYEETRLQMSEAGGGTPETNMLGWRGNLETNSVRRSLIKFHDGVDFDLECNVWIVNAQNRLTGSNFVSLTDHAKRWRYLMDVEGVGWSARLKLFFFSRRVVFLQDRPYKEWYFP